MLTCLQAKSSVTCGKRMLCQFSISNSASSLFSKMIASTTYVEPLSEQTNAFALLAEQIKKAFSCFSKDMTFEK